MVFTIHLARPRVAFAASRCHPGRHAVRLASRLNHLVHSPSMRLRRLTAFAALAFPTLLAGTAAADSLEPRAPGWLSKVYVEETTILASAETVFGVLVDLPAYPAWNPWIVKAEGPVAPGATVFVDVKSGDTATRYEHTVLVVEPSVRFCWKDAGWNAWFVYGQRCRWITALPGGGVKFRQELLIDGVLAWMADLTQGAGLRAGMAAETAALKARAESL
jgi:hypothetical protein